MRFRSFQREEEAEVQMAPLIDCVFILLIFFLVTSLLQKPHMELAIRVPNSGVGAVEQQQQKKPLSIIVTAVNPDDTDKRGEESRRPRDEPFIVLEGDLMTRELLERRLGQIAQQTPGREIRIDADGHLKWRYVVPVLDLCRFHGLVNVAIRVN